MCRLLTILGDVEPNRLVTKGILVRVESSQAVLICSVVAVHGGIVLVTEDNAGAGDAFPCSLAALAADRFLLITLELPLATSQAVQELWSEVVGLKGFVRLPSSA